MIRLRKLTLKSVIDFGKYSGVTVEKLIKVKPSSALYIYYNYEKISFTDEILDSLFKIFPNAIKIEKPGINKFFNFLNEDTANYKEMGTDQLSNLLKYKVINGIPVNTKLKNEIRIRKYKKNVSRDKPIIISKAQLQGINHGRK